VAASAEHQVFRIDRSGPAAYLKLAEPAQVSRELAVLQLLREHGVPVAETEAADPSGASTGVPCSLLREVAGEPTNGTSAAFCTAAPVLRQIHELRFSGSGYLTADAATLRGQTATWPDAMADQAGDIDALASAGVTDAELLRRAAAVVRQRAHVFTTPHNGHLVHGDFHPRHVYARGGRITAIIDWGDASSGDPRYDLGRILHSVAVTHGLPAGKNMLRRFLAGYGPAAWIRDRAELAEAALVYAIVFTLQAMHSELAGGSPWPPWWPAQTTALRAIVGELRGHS
jgi:aminoglycoside phosphotransferase (APT) family kinase protein